MPDTEFSGSGTPSAGTGCSHSVHCQFLPRDTSNDDSLDDKQAETGNEGNHGDYAWPTALKTEVCAMGNRHKEQICDIQNPANHKSAHCN
jgi:hypothetical protein